MKRRSSYSKPNTDNLTSEKAGTGDINAITFAYGAVVPLLAGQKKKKRRLHARSFLIYRVVKTTTKQTSCENQKRKRNRRENGRDGDRLADTLALANKQPSPRRPGH